MLLIVKHLTVTLYNQRKKCIPTFFFHLCNLYREMNSINEQKVRKRNIEQQKMKKRKRNIRKKGERRIGTKRLLLHFYARFSFFHNFIFLYFCIHYAFS